MSPEPPVKRTASKRREARHDPITRKGRSTSPGDGDPTTADTGRSSTEKTRTPGKPKRRVRAAASVTSAEVRDLHEKVHQMNGEQAAISRLRPVRPVTYDETVAMDIDPPSSEEASGPDPMRHRAAMGHRRLNRSPLSRPPLVPSTATGQELSNTPATALAPATASLSSPASGAPSFAMRLRCFPLTRRPPLEGSDVTLPQPETADSPSIVVHPPSDEGTPPPEWNPTPLSAVKPREKPYQSRRRSASLRPRTDKLGRYREDDNNGEDKGKKDRAGRSRSV
ncbi:MAG: hypothetical protein Q9207_008497 [Kuettlingeria erythrocarpa]